MKDPRPELPSTFDALDEQFFSLRQDDSYYRDRNTLGRSERDRVLVALRYVAADLALFDAALSEVVTRKSLLRDVAESTVRAQFHRLGHGGARLSEFQFSYVIPSSLDRDPANRLPFYVTPASNPPSNIHVLIGRNGVGKTHLLSDMTNALVQNRTDVTAPDRLIKISQARVRGSLQGLVPLPLVLSIHFDRYPNKSTRRRG